MLYDNIYECVGCGRRESYIEQDTAKTRKCKCGKNLIRLHSFLVKEEESNVDKPNPD
jgi:hypothetical protein